jgi:predicted ABC-type transport system involved in lysophospholipase L1 biosynthesis ATPase subunit
LDSPDAGEIHVAGNNLGTMSAYQRALFRRKTVGFVFQSFYLVPNLTAEQNIRLTLTLQGQYGKEREQLAREALAKVGLASRARHKPGQLSGGEQQRVTVARAIVNRPRVLLADEPTGNLDQATAAALMDLLHQLRQASEMTILMVTHDESLAHTYCDRLVRMRDGQFV